MDAKRALTGPDQTFLRIEWFCHILVVKHQSVCAAITSVTEFYALPKPNVRQRWRPKGMHKCWLDASWPVRRGHNIGLRHRPRLWIYSSCATVSLMRHISVFVFWSFVIYSDSSSFSLNVILTYYVVVSLLFFLFDCFCDSLTFALCTTLSFPVGAVACDEVPWYNFHWFGWVISCSIFMSMDYVTDGVFCDDVADDMVEDVHIKTICCFFAGRVSSIVGCVQFTITPGVK